MLPWLHANKTDLKQWEGTGEWTRPNYDWRITSNPITTGGSPMWHRAVRRPSFLSRWLSWSNLCPPADLRRRHLTNTFPVELPEAGASNFCSFVCRHAGDRSEHRCTINIIITRNWYRDKISSNAPFDKHYWRQRSAEVVSEFGSSVAPRQRFGNVPKSRN